MPHVHTENETPSTDTVVEEAHAVNMSIHIDEEFRSLLPDPGAEAVRQLTDSLLAEGCREPLIVWEYDGRHILLDGHHRHSICTAHHLPYQVVVKTVAEIPDRDAAMEWIDRNQLGRRNLAPDQFALVLGRLYNRQKQRQGGTGANQHTAQSAQNEHSARDQGKTAQKLAEEHGVSPATVRRAGKFAAAVDTLKSEDPDLETKVVGGKVTRKEVIEKAKAQKADEKHKQVEPPRDAAGRVIPESLRDLYGGQEIIKRLLADLRRIHDTVMAHLDEKDPIFALLHVQSFQSAYENLRSSLKFATFYAVCPYCGGDAKDCKACHGVGLVNKNTYEMAPRELKA